MFLCRIVFCLYHSAPEGAAVVYINNSDIFFLQSYITRAWGMPASFVHTCILFHTLWKVGPTGSCLLQRIALHGLTLALPYHTIFSKRNIDEFRLYVLLLTSSIRGHLLSLKFRPHRATRTPHRQHRKTVIHGTRLIPQHSKRGQNYTKWPKNYKARCTH
jgi:hypothetical protein